MSSASIPGATCTAKSSIVGCPTCTFLSLPKQKKRAEFSQSYTGKRKYCVNKKWDEWTQSIHPIWGNKRRELGAFLISKSRESLMTLEFGCIPARPTVPKPLPLHRGSPEGKRNSLPPTREMTSLGFCRVDPGPTTLTPEGDLHTAVTGDTRTAAEPQRK